MKNTELNKMPRKKQIKWYYFIIPISLNTLHSLEDEVENDSKNSGNC